MNIFKERADLYGRYSSEELSQTTEDFFNKVKSVKKKLGGQGYKLDEYIETVLKILRSNENRSAVDYGERFYAELRGICAAILNYTPKFQEHEFYNTAKNFIESNRFVYKEYYTLLELYCVLLTPQFADYAVKKFIKKLEDNINEEAEFVYVKEDYKFITDIVGKAELDDLNETIRKLFVSYPVLNSFLQTMNNQYLCCLMDRDPETSKRIFQLLTEVKE